MKYAWITFICLLILGCEGSTSKKTASDFIPKNASYVLKINTLDATKSNLTNSDFIGLFSESKLNSNLKTKLELLDYLNPNSDLLLSFTTDSDSLQATLATRFSKQLIVLDSTTVFKTDTLKTTKPYIVKTQLKKHTVYSTIVDSIFVASTNLNTLKSTLTTTKKDDTFKKLLATTDSEAPVSVLVNSELSKLDIFDSLALQNLSKYSVLDVAMSSKQIAFNGITKATDSTQHLINVFKGLIPQENQIQDITPNNANSFLSFTYNDFETLKRNLSIYQDSDLSIENMELFDNLTEIGVIYEGDNRAVVLNSLDILASEQALLNDQDQVETYRQVTIYKYSNPTIFKQTFNPLIKFNDATVYCIIDHFIVFANSVEVLQNIIANVQNKTTLSQRDYFKSITTTMSDEASLLLVQDANALQTTVNSNLQTPITASFKPYKASAVQFIYDNNFAHVNGIIKQANGQRSVRAIEEAFTVNLDADLLNAPQYVTNYKTRQKDIIVQDVNNNLYLISNTGRVLWKTKLDGPVLGTIEQIDIYKNGRLQLAFATPHHVYVLDSKGREVKPFAMTFKDEITQPLSVFDYDNKRNYRLMVTQGKDLLMYDTKGKIVKGFTFTEAEDDIIYQPQHFRIGSKDYLTFKTKNKLHILNRVGKTRVTPKTSAKFSDQAVYLYKGNFTTTTAIGELISIDTKGNINRQNLGLGESPNIITTSRTLIAQNENALHIKSNTLNLDFGSYTAPQLFIVRDKIYVAITDTQAQKVYVFDSNGKPISNFPIYGTSQIALDNADKDNALELAVKGADNEVIVLKF